MQKMGKITVETCAIEGLKVITPTGISEMSADILWRPIIIMIIRKQALIWSLCRTTSPRPRKACCGACISRSIIPRTRLVRVVSGEVFDVAVDLREGSTTYGQWYGVLLVRGE